VVEYVKFNPITIVNNNEKNVIILYRRKLKMGKLEYTERYCELLEQANEKEAKLEAFVQNWLNGNSEMSSEVLEKLIIYMYYKNFCNVLSNSDEQYNYYKEVSSLIKSNSLKYESTSNNVELYSSYMSALDKIKKIEVLSENKAFSNASVIGNVNKIVEDLKHVFYMCVAIEKKQYDDKIFSEDLQNLYETIYYYKSAFDSGCNNSYYESKVHRALMCYDRKLEILEKSIMKDFEEIADKLEFDY